MLLVAKEKTWGPRKPILDENTHKITGFRDGRWLPGQEPREWPKELALAPPTLVATNEEDQRQLDDARAALQLDERKRQMEIERAKMREEIRAEVLADEREKLKAEVKAEMAATAKGSVKPAALKAAVGS